MPETPERVVIAGATGLIGRALVASLRADGVQVTRLVRGTPEGTDDVAWDPTRAPLSPDILAGATAVVGLNGASIGHFPWTKRYRHTLLWSRLQPTQTLAAALRALGKDAPAFVSASAVGFYPSITATPLTEESAAGTGFLADLCVAWEDAARAASTSPVALLRTAPIVDAHGVLSPLMMLTRFGLGGPIGSGRQAWPWISLEDEVRAIRHVIDARIDGPVNLTGPTRATNNDLGFALARRMNRPYLLRTPAWAVRAALGRDAADALITCDMTVVPERLLSSGFTFSHPTVEDAVAAALPAS